MNRTYVLVGALALAVIVTAAVNADDKDKKDTFDIAKFMREAHIKKEENYRVRTQKAIKAGNWDDAEKTTKEWVESAKKLAKATPRKGDKESWDKLAGRYVKEVTNLHEASEKKDNAKATAALKYINTSCATCHKVHQPKD
jgi:hypothetical protein